MRKPQPELSSLTTADVLTPNAHNDHTGQLNTLDLLGISSQPGNLPIKEHDTEKNLLVRAEVFAAAPQGDNHNPLELFQEALKLASELKDNKEADWKQVRHAFTKAIATADRLAAQEGIPWITEELRKREKLLDFNSPIQLTQEQREELEQELSFLRNMPFYTRLYLGIRENQRASSLSAPEQAVQYAQAAETLKQALARVENSNPDNPPQRLLAARDRAVQEAMARRALELCIGNECRAIIFEDLDVAAREAVVQLEQKTQKLEPQKSLPPEVLTLATVNGQLKEAQVEVEYATDLTQGKKMFVDLRATAREVAKTANMNDVEKALTILKTGEDPENPGKPLTAARLKQLQEIITKNIEKALLPARIESTYARALINRGHYQEALEPLRAAYEAALKLTEPQAVLDNKSAIAVLQEELVRLVGTPKEEPDKEQRIILLKLAGFGLGGHNSRTEPAQIPLKILPNQDDKDLGQQLLDQLAAENKGNGAIDKACQQGEFEIAKQLEDLRKALQGLVNAPINTARELHRYYMGKVSVDRTSAGEIITIGEPDYKNALAILEELLSKPEYRGHREITGLADSTTFERDKTWLLWKGRLLSIVQFVALEIWWRSLRSLGQIPELARPMILAMSEQNTFRRPPEDYSRLNRDQQAQEAEAIRRRYQELSGQTRSTDGPRNPLSRQAAVQDYINVCRATTTDAVFAGADTTTRANALTQFVRQYAQGQNGLAVDSQAIQVVPTADTSLNGEVIWRNGTTEGVLLGRQGLDNLLLRTANGEIVPVPARDTVVEFRVSQTLLEQAGTNTSGTTPQARQARNAVLETVFDLLNRSSQAGMPQDNPAGPPTEMETLARLRQNASEARDLSRYVGLELNNGQLVSTPTDTTTPPRPPQRPAPETFRYEDVVRVRVGAQDITSVVRGAHRGQLILPLLTTTAPQSSVLPVELVNGGLPINFNPGDPRISIEVTMPETSPTQRFYLAETPAGTVLREVRLNTPVNGRPQVICTNVPVALANPEAVTVISSSGTAAEVLTGSTAAGTGQNGTGQAARGSTTDGRTSTPERSSGAADGSTTTTTRGTGAGSTETVTRGSEGTTGRGAGSSTGADNLPQGQRPIPETRERLRVEEGGRRAGPPSEIPAAAERVVVEMPGGGQRTVAATELPALTAQVQEETASRARETVLRKLREDLVRAEGKPEEQARIRQQIQEWQTKPAAEIVEVKLEVAEGQAARGRAGRWRANWKPVAAGALAVAGVGGGLILLTEAVEIIFKRNPNAGSVTPSIGPTPKQS